MGRSECSMRILRNNPVLRPPPRPEATPFLTGFANVSISTLATSTKPIRRVCWRQEGVATGEIGRPWVFRHLRHQGAEHLLNGSANEGGWIDQRLGEHGESIHPKAVQGLGGHGMETPVSRRRDVQDPHAV